MGNFGLNSLWQLSPKVLVLLPLGICCGFLLMTAGATYGLLVWTERTYQSEWRVLNDQLQQSIKALVPVLNQGGWLGITVMPALASSLPQPGLETRFADMRFLSLVAKRHQVAAFQVQPSPGKGGWRLYQLQFRADARQWISLLSEFAILSGVALGKQEWSSEGLATLQVRIAGGLPLPVVGRVEGSDGETQLIWQDGRLQRAMNTGERL